MAESDRDEKETPRRLELREFETSMTAVLHQARHGSSFVVTSGDEVLTEVHPPSKSLRFRRQPGALRGRIRMAGDFDVFTARALATIEGEEG
ncbi:MAG: prevent-host-death protein [Methylobacterium sp.]|uniref:prevent-host-death protein n=1 Tax=Methylobacterium sp. TaxID=409 RepID=UPI0025DA8CCB|nr:prevent-host-death protein [Methylobacterium sp.]MBX9930774.1 prevent-host-death protein [Methylobacterium sp.]